MFNFGSLLPVWLQALFALIDYLMKAADNWRDTAEGAKEWADFQTVYEKMLNEDNSGVVFNVEDNPNYQAEAQANTVVPDTSDRQTRARRGVVIQNDKP